MHLVIGLEIQSLSKNNKQILYNLIKKNKTMVAFFFFYKVNTNNLLALIHTLKKN